MRALVILPTLNEIQNLRTLVPELLRNSAGKFELLFVDDASTDGTLEYIQDLASVNPKIHLIKRPYRLGIGDAHRAGIRWAYDQGFDEVVTMDSDGSHGPDQPGILIKNAPAEAVLTLASRYSDNENSISDRRGIFRRILSQLAKQFRVLLIQVNEDAANGLRFYRLSQIPPAIFDATVGKWNAFLFEVVLLLKTSDYTVAELPLPLLPRAGGHSKLRFNHTLEYVSLLLRYGLILRVCRERLTVFPESSKDSTTPRSDSSTWDGYWNRGLTWGAAIYEAIASVYRNLVIQPRLAAALKRYFSNGATLVHAGCGGGQVDLAIKGRYRVLATDLSRYALNRYQLLHGKNSLCVQGDISALPYQTESIDGVYNLGVMEHFFQPEIVSILREFRRALKPDGKIVIFWPPDFGLSVIVLRCAKYFLRFVKNDQNLQLHPPEVSLIKNRQQVKGYLEEAGFELIDYIFSPKDLWVQVIVVAKKAVQPS